MKENKMWAPQQVTGANSHLDVPSVPREEADGMNIPQVPALPLGS